MFSKQRCIVENSYLTFLQIVIKFNNGRIIKFPSVCDLQASCEINRSRFGDGLQLDVISLALSISADIKLLN